MDQVQTPVRTPPVPPAPKDGAAPAHGPAGPPAATRGQAVASKGGLGWLVVLLVLGVLAGLGYAAYRWWPQVAQALGVGARTAAAQPVRATPVVAVPVRRGDLSLYLNGLGSVTALNTVTVRTRIDGQVDKVAYTEGQFVNAGDLLVQIDPRPYEVQLQQAQGQLAKDQATLENAKIDLARLEKAGDAVSDQQVKTAQATVKQDEAVLVSDNAAIANAKLQITYCRITAPISGWTGLRLVDAGNMVHANDANGLVVLTQLDPISVVFALSEDTLGRVHRAAAGGGMVVVDAYNRDLTRKLASGRLVATDNQIDPTTGMFKIKAQFDNGNGTLFPNQFVNVRLLYETRKDVVLAPAAALQDSPQGSYVYVVKSEPAKGDPTKVEQKVEVRLVKAGPTEGNQMIIEEGLAGDEVVVTQGVDKLKPGAPVVVGKPEGAATRRSGSQPSSSQPSGTRPGGTRPAGAGTQGGSRVLPVEGGARGSGAADKGRGE